jgi:hypothetical protein
MTLNHVVVGSIPTWAARDILSSAQPRSRACGAARRPWDGKGLGLIILVLLLLLGVTGNTDDSGSSILGSNPGGAAQDGDRG